MLRSLFSGITGLRQHQTLMDVVSNNISNVNTTGFKASSVVFEDTLSQTLKNVATPTATAGGVNAAQVGLGVQLGAITTNFGQGSAQNTGRSTDLMIQGDGFFVLQNGASKAYTRAGAFTFDTDGKLVNPEGMIVQGWMADTTGAMQTDQPVTNIKIPATTQIPPTKSNMITIGGNITFGTTTDITLGATVYDAAGRDHPLTLLVHPDTTGTAPYPFTVTVTDAVDSTTGTANIAFTTNGALDTAGSSTTTDVAITLADGTDIHLDLSKLTQYGGPKSVSVTQVDGAASGSLQQFQIQSDGSLLGIFSNGQKLTLAKLALANFNNPPGLEKMGNTVFRETSNSGLPQVGTSGSGGRGQLLGGTLEMSNVDLAQEFTNLIIAQRGFQANSRVITTSDQMLQDLVDIKR